MRGRWLPLEWLFLLIAVVRGAVEDDIARLRVSIRKDVLRMVPSCQHSFSQVELLNLHTTEPIVIHSIQTAPEETVLLSGGVTPAGQVWEQDDDVLPQQVHVSRLPSASLTLNPGQVALIPLTFLPRYPKIEEDDVMDQFAPPSDDWSSPRLSSSTASLGKLSRTARVDLEDMIGGESLISESPTNWRGAASSRRPYMAPMSATSPETYEVRTTILVETSRGIVKLPVTASSMRHNLFGVPDVIYFENTNTQEETKEIPKPTTSSMPRTAVDVMLLDTDIFNSIPVVEIDDVVFERKEANNTGNPDDNRQCYDIYISNPSTDREMEVSEIFVSKPELVTVEVKADDENGYESYRGHFPTGPSHVVRDWNQNGGPFILEPGAKDEYVATLCTASSLVPHDEAADLFLEDMARWFEDRSRESSLGYAQVRTQTEAKPDTLVIHLESWSSSKPSTQFNSEHEISKPLDDLVSNSPAESDRFATFDRSVFSSAPNVVVDGDILDLDEAILGEESSSTNGEPEAGLLLQALPSRGDLRIVRTAGNNSEVAAQTTFGVRNRAPLPLRIMRATVGMNAVDSEKLSAALLQLGLQLTIRIGSRSNQQSSSPKHDPFILPAESVVEDALILSCSIQSNTSLVWEDSLGFSGLVIVRATPDTHLSYDNWREEMKKNPSRDSQFVIEIPYSLRVVQGRIDFVMEGSTHPTPYLFHGKPYIGPGRSLTALFFPLSRYNLEPVNLLDEETPYEGTHLVHIIRVISNMPASLEVGSVAVRDSTSSDSSPVCKRFEVTHENKLAGQVREAWGLVDFGLITLRYFPANNEINVPPLRNCFLEVTTSPMDTGVHRVELVMYSGEIDVESAENLAPDGSRQTLGWHSTAVAGLDPFLQWLKVTRTGAFLRSLLASRRKSKNSTDEDLLQKYLGSVVDPAVRPDVVMKPILLQAGAIESGEVKTAFLFLTNNNPVPVVISIEVGEVEDLSIYAGRDKARSDGDGNSVLDYFPKAGRIGSISQSYMDDKIVPDGDWKGHPLKGLKQFLSSELSGGSLHTRVPYRSAISVSGAAILKQPMLRSLYADKGFVEFHSRNSPLFLNRNASSPCHVMLTQTSTMKHRRGRKGKTPNGPLLISDDGRFFSPRARCWVRKNEHNPVALEEADVVVPPGAVARFEIMVRAPPKSELTEDITQLFASGLVLSNDHGEVMPIFVAFEALQGQLHASHVSTTQDHYNASGNDEIYGTTVVDVEPQLFRRSSVSHDFQNSSSLTIYPESTNLTETVSKSYAKDNEESSSIWLFLRSTFSRNVRLRVVQSCNPWFEVQLHNAGRLEYLSGRGAKVGEIRSSIDCDIATFNGDVFNGAFASFYQCAWKWLTRRSDLQPRGCGLAQPQMQFPEGENDSTSPNNEANRAIRSLEIAMRVLKREFMDDESSFDPFTGGKVSSWSETGRRGDGYIAPFVVDVFAEAWYAWRNIASLGLNSLTSSLTAMIDCTATDPDPRNDFDAALPDSHSSSPVGNLNLTVSMQDISLRTSLDMPTLFDCSKVESEITYGQSLKRNGEMLSQLDFPPTLVGLVASMSIPLRNPTSVPVKVRLATASFVDSANRVSDERAKERFLLDLGMVYVQGGTKPTEILSQPWWEGGGAFYQADDDGDVLQSLHNVTIRGGDSAYVSVLNPSLHATSAFLMGCGSRCGIRDDPYIGIDTGMIQSNDPTFSEFSPIGASSAVGISLVGRRQRSHLSFTESSNTEEPRVPASGSLLPGKAAAPFAIPYSALDEIVLPPFAEATIGPIYFRPTGRFNILGCRSTREKYATNRGTKSEADCDSGVFESMLFLENSLTGIERIVLRGSGLWPKATFVDPHPTFGDDSYGHIETRNGRPALLFSGSAEIRSRMVVSQEKRRLIDSNPLPLVKEVMILNRTCASSSSFGNPVAQNPIKEVVLSNDGDVPLVVLKVFFSDSKAKIGLCGLGNFRLHDCLEDQGGYFVFGDRSRTAQGFKLFPRENRSFFIEHRSDCSKRREFVTLNVEHRPILRRSSATERRSPKSQTSSISDMKAFRRGRAELTVGYEMRNEEFRRCKPSKNRRFRDAVQYHVTEKSSSYPTSSSTAARLQANEGWKPPKELNAICMRFVSVFFACLMVFVFSWSNAERTKAYHEFRTNLKGRKSKTAEQFPAAQSNWQAAFRCLARLDPSSTELHGLGKEQVRQALGSLPPQCLSAAGSFNRDRPCVANFAGRAKDGGGGSNERAFTCSDAIFSSYLDDSDVEHRGLLPAGLGWRAAFSRGVINNSSFLSSSTEQRTIELLRCRRKPPSCHEDQSNERRDDSDGTVDEATAPIVDDHVSLSSNRKQVDDREHVENTEDVVSTSDSESTPPARENSALTSDSSDPHRVLSMPLKKEAISSTPLRKYQEMKTKEASATTNTSSKSLGLKSNSGVMQSRPSSIVGYDKTTPRRADAQPAKGHRVGISESIRPDTGSAPPRNGSRTTKSEKRNFHEIAEGKAKGTNTSLAKELLKPGVIRGMNDAESTHSPSSMSSRSSNQTLTDASPEETALVASPLRPPPGIKPPPGFLEPLVPDPLSPMVTPSSSAVLPFLSEANNLRNAEDPLSFLPPSHSPFSPIAFGGGDLLPPPMLTDDVTGSLLSDNELYPLSPSIGSNRIVPEDEVKEDLLSKSDAPGPDITSELLFARSSAPSFNVMDFLDNILNEGSTAVNTSEESGSLLPENLLPVSSNPWAFGRQSRAAAYGINFEDGQQSEEDSSAHNNHTAEGDQPIPLLTPAAILSLSRTEDEEAYDGSFYSSLLGE